MLKDVRLKKVIKSTITPVLTAINRLVPKRDDYILLYSANFGMEHNLSPLKKYLIENNYDRNNKIICGVSNMKYAEDDDRVLFVPWYQAIFYFFRSVHVFYTAGQIPIKPSKQQIVIHMNHGITGYKTMGALSNINNGDEFYFTYMIAPSPLYVPIFSKEYLCPEECIRISSEPMIDALLHSSKKYDFSKYHKTLLWMPTFRESDYLGYNDSSLQTIVPLFPKEDYAKLNIMLERENCLLIVKIHGGQSLNHYELSQYSHLKIYSNDDFQKDGYDLYELIGQVDGLISDYSSAGLQYLLTDNPIAYVIPDYDEYRKRRGFVFENAKDYMPGDKIYTQGDFEQFLKKFSLGIDNWKDERKRVRDLIHTYQDGNSCQRMIELSQIANL